MASAGMVGRIHDLQTRLKQSSSVAGVRYGNQKYEQAKSKEAILATLISTLFETQNSCGFTFMKSLNIETAKVCLMVLLQE